MTHEAGKGDTMRPTNHKAFSEGIERIFGKREVDEDEPEELEEDDTCSWCNGCGEGMYDGTACGRCKGTGVDPVEKDDDI